MNKQLPSKTIAKAGASIAISYLASKIISEMVGIAMAKDDPDKEKTMSAFTGAAITGGAVFAYKSIPDAQIASGVIIGAGLNTAVKIINLPKIKSMLPEKIQASLGTEIDSNEVERLVNERIQEKIIAAQERGDLPSPSQMQGDEMGSEIAQRQIPIVDVDLPAKEEPVRQLFGNETEVNYINY